MTSTETGQSWSERLNPRNWTLTWKLVVVGIVPALLALVLGILRVSDQAGAAADLGRGTQLLEVQEQVSDAADALRQERDEATLFVAGGRSTDRGVLDVGFSQADAEIDEMLTIVRGTGDLGDTTQSAVQRAESTLARLPQLRTDAVEDPSVDVTRVRTRYDELVEVVDVLDRALLRQISTPETAGLVDALTAARAATEQLAVQHTVLGAGISAGFLSAEDAGEMATDSELPGAFQEYQAALTPDQVTRFGNFLDDAANAQRERLKAAILATPPGERIAVPASEWDTAYNGSRAASDRSADLLRNELVAASQAAEEQASNLAGVNAVVLMLGLLIGIAVAVLIARALIRSLRVLRASALDVAERRLPAAVESMRAGHTPDVVVEPVPLSGHDEVGQVARAFDAVHGQAVRLAADQAALQAGVSAMFVNLSRRSQALVERQLQLIEQLESNEEDADQLSNLFQLDHLATRMRRNSENLLVLAGTDLSKRNVAPVPMVDVLRAAVSEVESYQRIVVQTPPTATVAGRAASDVVHLLAELLDNATNFSPPDSQVVMSTARATDGTIVVEIADRGVGMAEHELADANQRMSGLSSVDVSASRRMGLFVVGRLAARHGIGVRLTSSAGGQGSGLTASVTVPNHLIPSIEPVEMSRTASLPLAAGSGGGRPSVPPQRGVNGSARTGLSALVAGTDGPANPTGVFDAPTGNDGQLFTPQQAGPATPPPPSLPSRRPGSTLRPGGPPLPPGDQDRPERGGTDPAEEQAREVAAQARRDQEAAAARAAAARAEETARSESSSTETYTNGHAVGLPDVPDQQEPAASAELERGELERGERARGEQERAEQERAEQERAEQERAEQERAEQERAEQERAEQERAEQERAEQERAEQERAEQERAEQERAEQGRAGQGGAPQGTEAGKPANGQVPPSPSTVSGLPRRTPGRPPQYWPERPQQHPPTAEQARQQEQAAESLWTPASQAQPTPAPRRAEPEQRTTEPAAWTAPGQDEAEQTAAPADGGQVQPDQAPGPAQDTGAATAVSPPTMPMPVVRRTPGEPVPPPVAKPEAAQPASPAAPTQPAQPTPEPTAQQEVQRPAAPQPAAAQQPEVQRPAPQPAAAQQPAAPPAPRPTPRPTPRPIPQFGVQPAAEQAPAARPAPAPSEADTLFAPNVPVIAEPPSRAPSGRPTGSSFELGETTPIFEEIASAWFRSNRPIPVNWKTEQNGAPAPEAAPPAPPAPAPPPPPVPAARRQPTPRPPAPFPRSAPAPAPAPVPPPMAEIPVPAAPPPAPQPEPAVAEQEFASMADEGWRAASGAVAEGPDDVTPAGLPKRRPRARLVPGSAGSAVLAPPAGSTRSAESIRGRLASYQQGVRQGRESRVRGAQQHNGGTGPAIAGGNHDEESS